MDAQQESEDRAVVGGQRLLGSVRIATRPACHRSFPSRFSSVSTLSSSASAEEGWPRSTRAASRVRRASSGSSSSSASCRISPRSRRSSACSSRRRSCRRASTTRTSSRSSSSAPSRASTSSRWSTSAAAIWPTPCARSGRRWGRRAPSSSPTSAARPVARSAYAHSLTDDSGNPLGMIHRDVSPSNIMLSYEGGVKLLDFGIAKALGEAPETTKSGTMKGKYAYMAPEQTEGGDDVDSRIDIFSCGIVLHEVLTGRRLFKGTERHPDHRARAPVRGAAAVVPEPDVPARARQRRAQGAGAQPRRSLRRPRARWPTRSTTWCTRRASSRATWRSCCTICSRSRAAVARFTRCPNGARRRTRPTLRTSPARASRRRCARRRSSPSRARRRAGRRSRTRRRSI